MVLDSFFTKEELEPCRKETEKLVDELARKLFEAGKISGKRLFFVDDLWLICGFRSQSTWSCRDGQLTLHTVPGQAS